MGLYGIDYHPNIQVPGPEDAGIAMGEAVGLSWSKVQEEEFDVHLSLRWGKGQPGVSLNQSVEGYSSWAIGATYGIVASDSYGFALMAGIETKEIEYDFYIGGENERDFSLLLGVFGWYRGFGYGFKYDTYLRGVVWTFFL